VDTFERWVVYGLNEDVAVSHSLFKDIAESDARMLNAAYHEGRESVMAERGDLLYTDNSAVVERLSAENERLRAAHLLLMALGQSDGPLSWGPIVAKARAYYLAHK
jgi:hypothetical protein